ncbi:hypothetical protein LSS_01882 [Leptospira santarosai serovar Shermani str. LT 821]|uniref:Uncharacterized protein n=1 Tax=Leptospira santarosai serovar Shermani str. LT 821 TaxID=758847 RepID=K8YE20_9LEPT|nr:hypothetical protein LSS_01882 [Leptospira santarosai serovar Shermani str. LT 821]
MLLWFALQRMKLVPMFLEQKKELAYLIQILKRMIIRTKSRENILKLVKL